MAAGLTVAAGATVSPVIDLEKLLKPIAGENAVGQNLRYLLLDQKKGIYWHDRIREAHRENLFEAVPKHPDWPAVIELSTRALSTLTKDLQIAAWLSDALVKHNGHDRLAGLRDSLKLMRGLIADYWDDIYPESDPDGDDGRFKARGNIIAVFDARLSVAIKTIPLTESASGLRYSFIDWEDGRSFDVPDKDVLGSFGSNDLERFSLLKEQAEQEGKITSEDWRKAVNGTSYQFFRGRLDLLLECVEELTALDETIDLHFEREAPGVKELQRSLEDLTSIMKKLEHEKRPPELAAAAEMTAESGSENGDPDFSGGIQTGQTGQTRQEALRRLAEIAEYFRRTEPHSPVSYLVQRAVKWGNMPLDVWLEDVVKEGSVLGQLRETLGIKANNQS
ncbi:MAG: type VI secretion system protein TssA [Blastocatellia bacterium]|nr:type VI secretion system protein TssA [Blastocatellia bacterium]